MNLLSQRSVFRLIIMTLIVGTAYRLYPVVVGNPALSQFFMTEDGYLMLTIARNMAIGLGMSVSEGTIYTNGVQPLATFLLTVPYLITGGGKVEGLVGVHLILVAISVTGIFSVRALARLFLRPLDPSPLWPWFVAALWYVGPLLLFHTMNGLETGLYTVALTLTLVLFGHVLAREEEGGLASRMFLGAACGITFLARNDGAFLVSSIFAVWGLHGLFVRRQSLLKVVTDLLPPTLLCLLLAAPWLINNYVNFGSVVPISGTAQAMSGGFARNADMLPAILFEYFFPMLPVPSALQAQPAFILVAIPVILVILFFFFIGVWQRDGQAKYVAATYGLFALAICAYYGFFFGAGWFLSRYLAPLAPLLTTAMVYVLIDLGQRLLPIRFEYLLRFMGLTGIALSVALLGRAITPGVREQGHFQVVEWVTENVAEESWVGAVQTGTLGYWHDRTINLDGKVNFEALQALIEEGNVLNYVLKSPIDFIVDWSGIAAWITTGNLGNTAFSEAFELIIKDNSRNLAVLRRIK